jgi:hypothetical protein
LTAPAVVSAHVWYTPAVIALTLGGAATVKCRLAVAEPPLVSVSETVNV